MATQSRQSGSIHRFLHHWFRRETVTRALKVASVVGPTLTAINHYDVLWSLDFSPRLLTKILLTFLVPYSVSSFSSARAYMDSENRSSSFSTRNEPQRARSGQA
ncbi:MAG TPA: nitrate/nitrite transporter NrtS [Candidatus Binatia bacterium]|jgi:hypothetical protein|nr:nitrate/nitrite transporter NrtS [Candidatus Binatia bacterium]